MSHRKFAYSFAMALALAVGVSAQDAMKVVERPQKIKDAMAARGEQDQAAPVLKIIEPREGAKINGSTVALKLDLSGDLKGYHPHKDPSTGTGNHIHIILDNQLYEAYYEIGRPFELRNLTPGKHTIRLFASRPWHESYKNPGSFQMVTFTVAGGGDASKPTTSSTGQTMADAKPSVEGKAMPPSSAGDIKRGKPLLTYSRPKGEYKGADADAIMIDFWLTNAKLTGDGGQYRVRYSVDGGEAKTIEKWGPIWLSGWSAGKHTIKLELVDKSGKPVENGGYNSTTREITVTR